MRNKKPNVEILPEISPNQWFFLNALSDKSLEPEPVPEPIKGFFIRWFKETTIINTDTGNYQTLSMGGSIEQVKLYKLEKVKTIKALIKQEDGQVIAIPYDRVKFIRNEANN